MLLRNLDFFRPLQQNYLDYIFKCNIYENDSSLFCQVTGCFKNKNIQNHQHRKRIFFSLNICKGNKPKTIKMIIEHG